jgi:hypothetical protein
MVKTLKQYMINTLLKRSYLDTPDDVHRRVNYMCRLSKRKHGSRLGELGSLDNLEGHMINRLDEVDFPDLNKKVYRCRVVIRPLVFEKNKL